MESPAGKLVPTDVGEAYLLFGRESSRRLRGPFPATRGAFFGEKQIGTARRGRFSPAENKSGGETLREARHAGRRFRRDALIAPGNAGRLKGISY